MKKTSILFIIVIALSIGALFSTLTDSSTYADFNQAFSKTSQEFHVVGTWEKSLPIAYNPQVNANLFSFYLKDQAGLIKKVDLYKTKPQDFDKSEQIVLIGKANTEKDCFEAQEILLKCPSKYNEVPEDL